MDIRPDCLCFRSGVNVGDHLDTLDGVSWHELGSKKAMHLLSKKRPIEMSMRHRVPSKNVDEESIEIEQIRMQMLERRYNIEAKEIESGTKFIYRDNSMF